MEVVEAPLILNNREHYHPSRTILLKKHTNALKRMAKTNRRPWARGNRQAKMRVSKKPEFYVTLYPDSSDTSKHKHELVEMSIGESATPNSYDPPIYDCTINGVEKTITTDRDRTPLEKGTIKLTKSESFTEA